jgi:hypothetical protein
MTVMSATSKTEAGFGACATTVTELRRRLGARTYQVWYTLEGIVTAEHEGRLTMRLEQLLGMLNNLPIFSGIPITERRLLYAYQRLIRAGLLWYERRPRNSEKREPQTTWSTVHRVMGFFPDGRGGLKVCVPNETQAWLQTEKRGGKRVGAGRPKGSKNKPRTPEREFEVQCTACRRRGAPDDLIMYPEAHDLQERLCRPIDYGRAQDKVLWTLNPDHSWSKGDSGLPALGFVLVEGIGQADRRYNEYGSRHHTDAAIYNKLARKALECGTEGEDFDSWVALHSAHYDWPPVLALRILEGGK